MKYVLVNKLDEIVDTVDLDSNVGKTGATTYFQGVKKMPDHEDFHKLWKVMSKLEYDSIFKSSLQNRQVEWWKEEPTGPDDEFDYYFVILSHKRFRYSYCTLYSETIANDWDGKTS